MHYNFVLFNIFAYDLKVKSVKDFQIVVNIEESQNITFLRVPNLRNDIESVSDMQGSKHTNLLTTLSTIVLLII